MNMPCAVSGLRNASRPPLIAPMVVGNIRFIGLAGLHPNSPQFGHATLFSEIILSISSPEMESGFGCKSSIRWSLLKIASHEAHSDM